MREIIFADPTKDRGWDKIKRQWGEHWESNKELMLDEFCAVIYETKIACVGALVDCESFNSLPNLVKRVGDPHYLAFEWAILRSLEKVEWGESDAVMGLLLDDDYDKAMHCYALLHSLKKNNPETKKRISSICFCNDKLYPGVQAADMIAHESRRLRTNQETAPSPRYRRMTNDGKHRPHVFDAAALEKLEKEML